MSHQRHHKPALSKCFERFRVNPETFKAVEADRAKRGLSLSAWLREAVELKLKTDNTLEK